VSAACADGRTATVVPAATATATIAAFNFFIKDPFERGTKHTKVRFVAEKNTRWGRAKKAFCGNALPKI
jgi:hypothetical protein